MRKWDVGIGEYPKMKELERAKAKRAAKTAARKSGKATGRKAIRPASTEAEGENSTLEPAQSARKTSTRVIRCPARFAETSRSPKSSKVPKTPGISAETAVSSSSGAGFSLSFELRDLSSFEDRLSNSKSSIVTVKQTQIELRTLIEQEQNEINTLLWAHQEHAAVASALLERADRLLREMGAGVQMTGSSAIAQASSSRVHREDLDAMDLEDESEDESAK